jgi:hypothetical protein
VGTVSAALLVTGVLQAGGEFPLLKRTGLAQILRQSAWDHALAGLPAQPDWPWAETSAGTAGGVPRLGVSASIVKDSHADSTASLTADSSQDPHLPPGKSSDVSVGDRVTVTAADGSSRVYRVIGRKVVDPHLAESEPSGDDPTLVNCLPLDPVLAGSLRLVIQATKAEPAAQSAPKPEQKL